jgi:hypothetical protein
MGYSMTGLYQVLSGAAMFGAWAGGVLFLKFWSRTHDRLFLIFAIAFWIMALERVVLAYINSTGRAEDHSMVYLIRLCAFLLIISAIIDKNREAKKQP